MIKTFLLFLISWLIPGSGFIMKGKYLRGFTLFSIITLIFFIGILMHGEVSLPNISPKDWGYNIMSVLSFAISLGSGFLSILSLLSIHFKLGLVNGLSYHPLYELALFFIVVAGAMNYFVVCNFYDRYYKKDKSEEKIN